MLWTATGALSKKSARTPAGSKTSKAWRFSVVMAERHPFLVGGVRHALVARAHGHAGSVHPLDPVTAQRVRSSGRADSPYCRAIARCAGAPQPSDPAACYRFLREHHQAHPRGCSVGILGRILEAHVAG